MSGLSILMYHKVARPGPESKIRGHYVTPDQFGRHLRLLDLMRVPPACIDDLDLRKNGRAVAITFDDGYANFATEAWPRLKAASRPATVFVVTGLHGKTDEWDGGQEPLLTGESIRKLAEEGVAFGSHTVHHADLTNVPHDTAVYEVEASRAALAALIGREVSGFCYPYGRYHESVRQAVIAAGYGWACSTRKGANSPNTDRFALRRINVRADTSAIILALKLLRDRVRID